MKIAAFTILEMIITLLLMSVIVSMVYVVYDFMSKNTMDYIKMTQENFSIRHFQSVLQQDVYNAQKISKFESSGFNVFFYNGTVSKYRYSNGHLLRSKGNQVDSIPLLEIELQTIYDEYSTDKEIVSNIAITTNLFGNKVPIYVFKNYYSRMREQL